MKIKIYVDWENHSVYDENAKADEIKRKIEENKNDEYFLNDFLDDYCYQNMGRCEKAELFKISEEKRAEVNAEFAKKCEECAKEEFTDETEEIEIEV